MFRRPASRRALRRNLMLALAALALIGGGGLSPCAGAARLRCRWSRPRRSAGLRGAGRRPEAPASRRTATSSRAPARRSPPSCAGRIADLRVSEGSTLRTRRDHRAAGERRLSGAGGPGRGGARHGAGRAGGGAGGERGQRPGGQPAARHPRPRTRSWSRSRSWTTSRAGRPRPRRELQAAAGADRRRRRPACALPGPTWRTRSSGRRSPAPCSGRKPRSARSSRRRWAAASPAARS